MSGPKVVIYQVASVDGRLAFTPDVPMLRVLDKWRRITGESEGLSFDMDKWLECTYQPQAFLEGSGSFVGRNQEPRRLPAFDGDTKSLYRDFLPDSVVKHPELRAWGAVVDSRGRGRNWLRWVNKGCHVLILVANRTPSSYLAYLQRKNLPYLVAGEERVDLHLALGKLKSQLGVTCVCSTGGGRLNGALLRQGLVDEVNILIFPAVIGGMETPALFDSPDLTPDDWPTKLRLISVQVLKEGHVWLRYEVVRE